MGNMKNSYNQEIKTSFPIENRYRNYGIYAASDITFENVGIERVNTIRVYYPNEMIISPGKKYPLIIIANGSNREYRKIEPIFKHLCSWGFIVGGNDDPTTGKGDSIIKTLHYILNLNNKKESILYNKINIEKIGITGNSQGGCGVINSITKYREMSHYFKCAFISCIPTKSLMDKGNFDPFRYRAELINIPTMIVCGAGMNDVNVCHFNPAKETKEIYDEIGNNIKKVYAVRKKVDNKYMQIEHDPYMTAWFCYILKDDKEAEKAFCGKDSEILKNNENWQNCVTNNL